MDIANKLNTIADNMTRVYEAGKAAGNDNYYDTFWDTFQDNGNRRVYFEGFRRGWTDENYNPKYPIVVDASGNTNAYDIFIYNNKITDTKVDIDVTQAKAVRSLFMSCTNLVTIRKIITNKDITGFTNSFTNCTSLENITFEGEIGSSISLTHSSKLSDESIQNIIEHLADLTSGTAQTLTLHKTVGNKLTDEQKEAIAAKNWTLAY